MAFGQVFAAKASALPFCIIRSTVLPAGLSRVLITCCKNNVASARTIVRNGGVLESEEYLANRGEVVQRYWINIA
jgi:predicted acetyltransferase